MKSNSNSNSCFDWELHPSDITSEVCNKCIKSGPPHCCEISLGQARSKMSFNLIERAIEGYDDHLRVSDRGEVFLICTHLDRENGVCTIYEDRPQLCRDYNCVSWAQVDHSRGAPKETLDMYNKVVKIILPNQQQKQEEVK